jgi:hypothetical protein
MKEYKDERQQSTKEDGMQRVDMSGRVECSGNE